ncbi:MAG TPA: chemotaxis-specific protein-glutamate methyltransferase CheB [Planctomycetota bacterium]|nr:chemotaxis-specific protein-glutamate methyltransferase CheB [Planctomycetota bacterium]
MGKVRVLVVEDSLSIRKRMMEILSGDPGLDVVGEAGDGKSAIELCQALKPDVVTLDMMLPVMTGLAATEYIMAYCPTPILIVSASTNRGELFRTYEALAAGALDVLDKPNGEETSGEWEERLISTVKLLSKIKVITHPRARLGGRRYPVQVPLSAETREPSGSCGLIAIGASTGGPAAMLQVLKALPREFPLPILFVLHLGRSFAGSFAEWLDAQSPIRVSYAKNGDPLPKPGQGRVIMAPPDRHLVLRQGTLRLTSDPERHSCRPSVDVLFESLALESAPDCAAFLLTGMGRDGAQGLLAIRQRGGTTVAQDEASCVVYGMPREAALLGAAERVLPLQQIAPALMRLAGFPEPGRRA